EFCVAELWVRRHQSPRPEGRGVPNPRLEKVTVAILGDVLRNVQLGADLATHQIQGMAGETVLVSKSTKPAQLRRAVGGTGRNEGGVALGEIHKLDPRDLPRPREGLEVRCVLAED